MTRVLDLDLDGADLGPAQHVHNLIRAYEITLNPQHLDDAYRVMTNLGKQPQSAARDAAIIIAAEVVLHSDLGYEAMARALHLPADRDALHLHGTAAASRIRTQFTAITHATEGALA